MHSVIGFTVFGVDWEFFKPYIVLGLALGGAYALSGVGIVVLYQATGVLNLAFGAIGAAGRADRLLDDQPHGPADWLAFLTCIAFGGAVTFLYGVVLGPAFARRDPLVKMMGTLGPRADPARPDGVAGTGRRSLLPGARTAHFRQRFELFGAVVNWTQVARAHLRDRAHVGTTLFLKHTKLGTATGRSPPTARSPPHSACPSAGSRLRHGSARGSSAAPPGLLLADLTRRSTTPR